MEQPVEESLTGTIATIDPIETVFDINEQMFYRVSRIRYVFTYAFWAGIVALVAATVAALWVVLTGFDANGTDWNALVLLSLAIVVSAVAVWFSHQERPFLSEYQVLAGAVHRAKNWEPNPKIPELNDPIDRFIAYLDSSDDRFAYFHEKKPEYLVRDVLLRGGSKKEHHFDAFFEPSSFPWDHIEESVRVFIRVVDGADISDVEDMREAVEDVFNGRGKPRWAFKPCATRIILIDPQSEDFDDELIEAANENRVKYERELAGYSFDWSVPVELVGENLSDVHSTYSFGTVYFG